MSYKQVQFTKFMNLSLPTFSKSKNNQPRTNIIVNGEFTLDIQNNQALPGYISMIMCVSQHNSLGMCSTWNAGALRFVSLCIIIHSNQSPTRCNNFPVYYPDVYLQLNMFWAFSCPSSGAQWLQWQPLVLPTYCGDSSAVAGLTTNTAQLSPWYEGKSRGCHCSHWAPDVDRENAQNMFSYK
jgi:hypothetical protein